MFITSPIRRFFKAIRRNQLDEITSFCLKLGPNAVHNNKSALMYAAQIGRKSAVEQLLKGGADTRWVDFNGQNALIHAVLSGNWIYQSKPCHLYRSKCATRIGVNRASDIGANRATGQIRFLC